MWPHRSTTWPGCTEDRGRYGEAEPLFQRSLAIYEKALGPDHPEVATALNNLAVLYEDQGRYGEAEPLYQRSLAIAKKALGPDHPDVATALNNLAELYKSQGRYDDAEPLYQRALAIYERALGPEHPDVGTALRNLAGLYFATSDWAKAAEYGRRSTNVIMRRAERGTAVVGKALIGKGQSEAELWGDEFWRLIKAAHRLAGKKPATNIDSKLAHEMFETAQWARGSEAGSVARADGRTRG